MGINPFVNISQCLFMFLNLFFVLDIVIVDSIWKFSWFLLLFQYVLPYTYKLHFNDYFIVDFELSPNQTFSLDSMNVCYLLYWLNDGCVVWILISISFWICEFVFLDFFVLQLPLLIANFMIVDLPDWIYSYAWWFFILFCFLKAWLDFSLCLDDVFKNSWYLQSNSGLNLYFLNLDVLCC